MIYLCLLLLVHSGDEWHGFLALTKVYNLAAHMYQLCISYEIHNTVIYRSFYPLIAHLDVGPMECFV